MPGAHDGRATATIDLDRRKLVAPPAIDLGRDYPSSERQGRDKNSAACKDQGERAEHDSTPLLHPRKATARRSSKL
jgi:hypothetical protein